MEHWQKQIRDLEQQHQKIDDEIDNLIRQGLYEDQEIHILKKHRLHLRDEIVKIRKQHQEKS